MTRIADITSWTESVPLTRPYTIATRTIDQVGLHFLRLTADDGTIGLGAAAPAREVTGESNAACAETLAPESLGWLRGRDCRQLFGLCRELERHYPAAPAARVAIEMALHDMAARKLDLPLVELLGRCHEALPTSITIGIKESIEEALAEAEEFCRRGFQCLKVKIGLSFEQDRELLRRLRERVGGSIRIRVDANLGYSLEQTREFWPLARELELELVEQPVPVADFPHLTHLPEAYRHILAADESLQTEADALELLHRPRVCGIYNIKLMKCGGLSSALSIARIAERAGLKLMWGCMDESVISISAALHTAYACPSTRYLDLDGSFDLPADPARGGFRLQDGFLHLLDRPGLGVDLRG